MKSLLQKFLRFSPVLGILILLAGILVISSCTQQKQEAVQSPFDRGKYLVTAMGCQDCHSPHDDKGQVIPGKEFTGHWDEAPLPEWDESMLKKNIFVTISPDFTAFAGPFGVSVATNLTPDKKSGIGDLTADQLIKSWREGKHWQVERDIMPPMPYMWYKELTDDDIRAIHTYLMSLTPVNTWKKETEPKPAE